MATRCNIGIFEKPNEEGVSEVRYIYSHWDGYPDGVGSTLKNHYTDEAKIRKLIDGGDISSLGEEVEIPDGVEHSFDNQSENITVFYGRDRGESGTEAQKTYMKGMTSIKSIKENEYLYIYEVESGEWLTF